MHSLCPDQQRREGVRGKNDKRGRAYEEHKEGTNMALHTHPHWFLSHKFRALFRIFAHLTLFSKNCLNGSSRL